MMITLQSRPCPRCGVENMADAEKCHACAREFRCARVEVIEMPVSAAPPKPRPKPLEKSMLGHCVAKIDALLHRNYDISGLKID